KICDAFIGRIKANQASIKHLQQKKKEDETYHKNFVHFTDILRKVKDFLNYVTQLHGLKNFININNVREKSELLAKEFDGVIQDLHFTQTVSSQRQSNSDQQSSKVVNVVGAVSEAVEPFIPLISIASAQRQSKIDLQILKVDLEVVNSIEYAVKPFIPLIGIVTVTRLLGYKRFLNTNNVKEKFESLAKEFDSVMYDLHFTPTVSAQRQSEIDQQSLMEDLSEMTKFLDAIHGNIVDNNKQLNTVLQEVLIILSEMTKFLDAIHGNIVDNKQQLNTALQEVLIIKGQIDSMDSNENVQPNDNPIKAAQISPTMLEDPNDQVDDETKNLQQGYAKIIRGAWEDDPLLRSSLQNIFLQLDRLCSKYPSSLIEKKLGLYPSKYIDFDGSLRGDKKPVSVSDEDGDDRLCSKYPSSLIEKKLGLYPSKYIDFDGSLRGDKKPVSVSDEDGDG
ncbi:2185_t:CDS:2, partial [Entrophospora sp. SA101]